MLVPYEMALLASSDPSAGSQNLSADGSSFEVQLQEAIEIPKDAEEITIEAQEAAVWFTTANIKTGVNDTLYVTQPNAVDGTLTDYVVTIEQGLYNRTQMYAAFQREIVNQGGKAQSFGFLSEESTQRIILAFNDVGTSIDFNPNNTPRFKLGFLAGIYGPFNVVPRTVIAQNVAQFASIQFWEIHTDLTNNGIRVNNTFTQAIAQVNIDKPPGSQVLYRPFNATKIPCPELRGSSRTNIRFWLTDQSNNLVDTNSEYWSVRVVVRYLVPLRK
jgi:hypothetical protein